MPGPASESLPSDPWPAALSGGRPEGRFRQEAGDFRVEELLPFAAEGEGPHILLRIRKRDVNTERVARDLASLAGCRAADVGFAGLKDRKSVAVQHFTVPADGWAADGTVGWEGDSWAVVGARRCRRKLRRGAVAGNIFRLRLELSPGDRDRAEGLFRAALERGVPNYFGPQRFGREGGNLTAARAWLVDGQRAERSKRGFYLSAARSYLFNRVLAERVGEGTWDRLVAGDLALFDGKRSGFVVTDPEAEEARLAAGAIHPSGPLPGVGTFGPGGEASAREESVLAEEAELVAGLRGRGVAAQRRALRTVPREGECQRTAEGLWIGFRLAAGAFATSVVREVISAGRGMGDEGRGMGDGG